MTDREIRRKRQERQLERALILGDHAAEIMLRARLAADHPEIATESDRDATRQAAHPGHACDLARQAQRKAAIAPWSEAELRFASGDR